MNQYWMGILAIGGIALVLVLRSTRQFFQQDKIVQSGIRVVGRITNQRETFSLPDGRVSYTAYYLTYSYEYEGKTYTREQQVSKKVYLTYGDETKVSVHFMPNDPTHAVINFDEIIR